MEDNPCQTNPCLHGGSCLQEGDGYSCYCPQGFSGESCEIGESLPGQRRAGKTLGVGLPCHCVIRDREKDICWVALTTCCLLYNESRRKTPGSVAIQVQFLIKRTQFQCTQNLEKASCHIYFWIKLSDWT